MTIKHLSPIAITLVLSGCMGSSDTTTSGPGEVSYAGLTYDVTSGGSFTGLAATDAGSVPTAGTASYAGVLRGNILGDYRDGTSAATADFGAGTINVSGSIDFTGTATGDGLITYNETATITGNSFSVTTPLINPGDTNIAGGFYGTDASVIGATVNAITATGNNFSGAMIAAE